jgi:hypothetical protein
MMEDVGSITNTLQIPARFYEPLVWGLSWLMACKYAPDKAESTKGRYDEAFLMVSTDDSEGTPLSIYGDLSGGNNRR